MKLVALVYLLVLYYWLWWELTETPKERLLRRELKNIKSRWKTELMNTEKAIYSIKQQLKKEWLN